MKKKKDPKVLAMQKLSIAWNFLGAQDILTFLKHTDIDFLLILDELLIGSDARKDVQTETCDFTACNGFTYKLDVFEKVETYGECQYPAGKNGRDDDFFCFVNEDSACYKVNYYILSKPKWQYILQWIL